MQPIYQSYQQQQQFTSNAAHELRSPLASLLATVEAILRIPPSNQQDMQIMLHTVERQGRRLSHLIADLLLLTSLRFYRVDSDAYGGLHLRSRKTGGTGLGLAIAVAIAQKHQAILKVESQVGKGSVFTLEMKVLSSKDREN